MPGQARKAGAQFSFLIVSQGAKARLFSDVEHVAESALELDEEASPEQLSNLITRLQKRTPVHIFVHLCLHSRARLLREKLVEGRFALEVVSSQQALA